MTFEDTAHPFFFADEVGKYVFTLKVQDDNESWSLDEDTVNITIVEPGVNLPPSADAGIDIRVTLGDKVTLNGTGSEDPDGEILSWIWTCLTHTGVVLSDTNSSKPYFTPTAAGTYRFRLVVMDINHTYSEPDDVVVIVEEPYVNARPIADAGEDIYAYEGDLVTLDGSESFDVDGIIEDYNWTCTNHTLELVDANSSKPSFIAELPGEYVFSLSVMDDSGAWST